MNINLQLFICRKLGVKISFPERYQAAFDAGHVISCIGKRKEGEKLLKTHLYFSTRQVDDLSALKIAHLPHPLLVYPETLNAPNPRSSTIKQRRYKRSHQSSLFVPTSSHPPSRTTKAICLPALYRPALTLFTIHHPISIPYISTHAYLCSYHPSSSSSLSINYFLPPHNRRIRTFPTLRYLTCLPTRLTD